MISINTPLTKREHQVLTLIADELTMQEIAKELFISNHTVISHRKKIQEKLCARNTAGLIRRAFELRILELSY